MSIVRGPSFPGTASDDRGVFVSVSHCNDFAALRQEMLDGLPEIQHVEADLEIGKARPDCDCRATMYCMTEGAEPKARAPEVPYSGSR